MTAVISALSGNVSDMTTLSLTLGSIYDVYESRVPSIIKYRLKNWIWYKKNSNIIETFIAGNTANLMYKTKLWHPYITIE